MHHGEDDTELSLRSSSNDYTRTAPFERYQRIAGARRALRSPLRTNVPMYAIQVRSAMATGSIECIASPLPCRVQGATVLLRDVVSPVKLLSSISRSSASIRRMSAGTRSPVENVTMSPGTTSLARTWTGWPSLSIEGDQSEC